MRGRGHAWQEGREWSGACMVGGMRGGGACMVGGACVTGGVHGKGTCIVGGICATYAPLPPPPQALRLRYTVNERAVRILLECILVFELTLNYFV